MFTKVLIANRGEISCRIIRTLRKMGVPSVAVYSEPDRHALHVAMAGEAVCLGPAPAAESYLNTARLLETAASLGVDAIHPGYGFLSENADFADACAAQGIHFIGPTPGQLREFGLKHTARELAALSKVPMLPGSGLLASVEEALMHAGRIGFPVMLKSSAGGGGIGLQLCANPSELREKYEIVKRLSQANFSDGGIYVEKFVDRARHIEVQIFGDGKGGVLALGERDCSVQRRNQKVIEETPAPHLAETTRQQLFDAAVSLGQSVHYASAGTVEFVYDATTEAFYFLEVNTRLQVEHGITEEVTGIDLVEWMILQAAGELPPIETLAVQPAGHAIQVRVYAEDPNKNFQPSSGLLTEVHFPEAARVDAWIETGTEVSPFYDPLLAKIIVKADDRSAAIAAALDALEHTGIHGIETNQVYLSEILKSTDFAEGRMTTRFLNAFPFHPNTIDVLEGGTQTAVQDFPGRLGYWSVGVPPSGPMDPFAFRIANRILGNAESAAALELTMSGPTLRFNAASRICLTGASMPATLDGVPIAFWEAVDVLPGQTLRIGQVDGPGVRAYLAIAGGIDVPDYLGSKSTFAMGGFGGHGGRLLRAGDVLRLTRDDKCLRSNAQGHSPAQFLTPGYQLNTEWTLGVLYGPHGAPDFFTSEDIDMLFGTSWEVHYNSNRTGIRLIGPKPKWARKDGGEAGLHPSNIHDNAYAIGAVDFTGDMPILLGPDGPSLGGFVCPAVVVEAERWKLGQLKAGNKVRFHRLTVEEARQLAIERDALFSDAPPISSSKIANSTPDEAATSSTHRNRHSPSLDSLDEAILHRLEATSERPAVTYRGAGDRYLLVEYGPIVLDLTLRFRVHALHTWLEAQQLPGIIDLTPGIRSLQIHFDNCMLPEETLLEALLSAEEELPLVDEMEVPTRIVHLPLSWEDEATLQTIQKYMQSVRADAPWCPSNLEFIRRINGLDSIDDVRRIVFDASYLVLGLGDVYLGAPVATPIDPRHRLVTTKYNPARTWTPPNVVGIGGAYMCIYGMEGPGGYQLFGRTIQVWNSFRTTPNFESGKPWLLRFFDQIRFYPVSHDELMRCREDFLHGKYLIKTEDTVFRLSDYHRYLAEIAEDATAFKACQQAAFEEERERWAQAKYTATEIEPPPALSPDVIDLPDGGCFVDSTVAGSLWKFLVAPGDPVAADQPVAIIESMKMEIQICASRPGLVHSLLAVEGTPISPGQHLVILAPTL